VQHTIEKLSTRVITLFQTSFQSKVYTQSYGGLKLQKSQLWEFRDSHFGVLGQNAIWVLVPWRGTKYIIRGKVVASPKSRPWWILWIWITPWLVLAPKVLKLCINQLVVWVVQVRVNGAHEFLIWFVVHVFLPWNAFTPSIPNHSILWDNFSLVNPPPFSKTFIITLIKLF
jgi:hypothetical protein